MLHAIALVFLFIGAGTSGALAQQPGTPAPEKLSELMRIIDDPEIRAWVESRGKQAAAAGEGERVEAEVKAIGAATRARLHALSAAVPKVPAALVSLVSRITEESRQAGLPPPAVVLVAIVLLALAGEWLSRRMLPSPTGRENPLLVRTLGVGLPLVVFTLTAMLVFVSVAWPPVMDTVIFFYLLAAVAYRLIGALLTLVASAGGLSGYLRPRLRVFLAVLVFGIATVSITHALRLDGDIGRVIAVFFSMALLLVTLEAIWRDPSRPAGRNRLFLSLGVIVLWLAWAAGLLLVFWTLVYIAVLPKLLQALDRLTRAFAASRWGDAEDSLHAVLVMRGVRAAIIGLAVAWLAVVWQVNPRMLGTASTNSVFDAVFLGLLKSVVVILLADLGWSLASAMIRRKLTAVETGSTSEAVPAPVEAARRARVKTLLPIFRNGLAAVILVVTVLMVLAELGVEIGPLIAGAGVFGVAIGFGSQTLVKDVISGVFYLMDDAFRVGEYIQSGSYMGTVESFSLRSVRLRHHRGPIFTVPFGELGAVQNMSRDWAIDKFRLKVSFDADIAKVKRIAKAVGAELQQDPEIGPLLIQTLKMKGVEQISDFGVELSFAFTAVPGQQAYIRRRAYTMIRKAFSENGIGFAQPTVQVGGDDKGDAAAAALMAQTQRAAADAALKSA